MEELLSLLNAGNITVIVVAGVIYWPLKQSVDTLSRAVERLADALDDTKTEINQLRERMVAVEAKTSAAHHRIDRLEAKE